MAVLRRTMMIAVTVAVAAGAVVWFRFGPFNGPSRPPPLDRWEQLLRERIVVPEGYRFDVYARDLGRPRLMQLVPNGDLIVSGYRDGTLQLVKADKNSDGRSDGTVTLGEGLDHPHGLLLEGDVLFVAEETRVRKFRFDGAALTGGETVLSGIPAGGHSSRTLRRGPDGYLYLSVGSSCNACIEDHPWRAAILRFDEGEAPEVFAAGLRNTVGFDWEPGTGLLYGVDNGRDNLGDDVPDDEVNLIARGQHYGWPYRHGTDIADPELAGAMPSGLSPAAQYFGLGGHVAPLALRFLGPGEALVTEHGSWNRSSKAGYRIMRLTIDSAGMSQSPFLTGCEVNDNVICRPVDVLPASDGSLFVTDDYAGAVYRIAKAL